MMVGLSATGCRGGSNSLAPGEACKHLTFALCERFFACHTDAEIQAAGPPAACIAKFESDLGCTQQTSSLLLALVCASIVADHDRSWLARPVAQLIPEGGPRADRLSRLKAKLRPVFADLVDAATRRGRRPAPPRDHRAPVLEALLAVATRLLTLSTVPVRRRAVQDELVCVFDRVHREHGATVREFCAALALSERTFRSWQDRPAKPPPPGGA